MPEPGGAVLEIITDLLGGPMAKVQDDFEQWFDALHPLGEAR